MKDNLDSIPPARATGSETSAEKAWPNLRILFWCIALGLGLLQCWGELHFVNLDVGDGTSYLDMGDAYWRGDWKTALNGYWSPFYAWLLGLALLLVKPSPYRELTVVQGVNLVVYLGALASFEFFLRSVIAYQRQQTGRLAKDGLVTLPEWAWMVLGYALFIWSSLELIDVSLVTPDMCVAAFVYLASGLLLRIRGGCISPLTFFLFGVALGFGYLAKAVMFPMAFVFLGVSFCSLNNWRRAVPLLLVALFGWLLLASPFILALSLAQGRPTFGDSARLNYAHFVNDAPEVHWQGNPPGTGVPRHPTRKIFDSPAIYEFSTPIRCSYPLWYDRSYWNEGLRAHFDLRQQTQVLFYGLKGIYDFFLRSQGYLVAGVLILFLSSGRKWACLRDVAENWHLLIPAAAAFGIYALIFVQTRYLAPFVVPLWVGVLSAVRLPSSPAVRRIMSNVVIVWLVLLGVSVAGTAAVEVQRGLFRSAHVQWEVASGLSRMGIRPGDKVASIGYTYTAYWARLAQVQIVAEIHSIYKDEMLSEDVKSFWAADASVKDQIYQAFAKTGAKVVVARNVPSSVSTAEWQRIGNTHYYAHFLLK